MKKAIFWDVTTGTEVLEEHILPPSSGSKKQETSQK
jgi:hypothetical protein